MYNGIAFFQLPTNRIDSANLTLTVDTNSGPLTNANIDVWGLGYMAVPYMSSAWTLAADTDARALINANVPFAKLADNIVTAGQATAVGSAWSARRRARTSRPFSTACTRRARSPATAPSSASTPTRRSRRCRTCGSEAPRRPDRRPKLTLTLSDASALATTECAFLSLQPRERWRRLLNGHEHGRRSDQRHRRDFGTQDYNGIAFFPLPEQPLTSVSLSLPAVTFSGVMPSANIDVWLLGYQTVPALTTAWYCTNDVGNGVATRTFPP